MKIKAASFKELNIKIHELVADRMPNASPAELQKAFNDITSGVPFVTRNHNGVFLGKFKNGFDARDDQREYEQQTGNTTTIEVCIEPTPSEEAKLYGCKSLKEVSDASGLSVQTLINWHTQRPFVFRAVCELTAKESHSASV